MNIRVLQTSKVHRWRQAHSRCRECVVPSQYVSAVTVLMAQVAAIEAGTREPAPARAVAENDMVQHQLSPQRAFPASDAMHRAHITAQQPAAAPLQLTGFRRLVSMPWTSKKRSKRFAKQVCTEYLH